MKHEWKIGDWCELTTGSVARWMVFFVHSQDRVSIVNASGHTITHKYPSELRHLDGCDSWDWQPPKPQPEYRPFANATEFAPHRDKWLRHCKTEVVGRVGNYSDVGVASFDGGAFRVHSYEECLRVLTFDDGSPFGVVVSSKRVER